MHVTRIQKPGYSQHVMSLCIIILQVSRLTACVRLWHAPPHVSIFTLNSMGGANKLKSSFVQIYRAHHDIITFLAFAVTITDILKRNNSIHGK